MSKETKVFIGQCMNNYSILQETIVTADDFIVNREKQIFEHISKISRAGHIPEITIISSSIGMLVSDLIDYQTAGEITANWKWYESAVIEQKKKHRLMEIAERVTKDPYVSSDDICQQVAEVAERRSRYNIIGIDESVNNAYELVKERRLKGVSLIGVTSGLRSLDEVLYGFQKRRLYYFGARPSMGKTMVLLNFLLKCNVSAGFISAESAEQELAMRVLSNESGVDSMAVLLGHLGDRGIQKVDDARHRVATGESVQIYDESNMHINTLIAKAWSMKRSHDIKILFVDYLQALAYPEAGTKRHEQVQAMSKKLKQLARDLDIPVVASAQLRRDAEGVRPKLSDFSDSTQIERDADVAVMIHQDSEMIEGVELKRHFLLVEKNRDGRKTDIKVNMNYSNMRLIDIEK